MRAGLTGLLAGVLLLGGGSVRAADEKVFSGPQKGEKLPALKVVGVFDDLAGKEVDFVKQADGKPTLLIFVHPPVTRPSAAVTRVLTSYAESRARDGLQAYIVWLGADRTESEAYLKRARQSLGLKVPVGISLDGVEGPGAFGLNRKMSLTILVAKDSKVTANYALVQPSVTETPKIAEDLVKLIGGKAPTQEELEKLANPGRGTDTKPKPDPNRPGAPPKDPKLVELMRGVISPQNKPEDVEKAVAAVEEYVAKDKEKQTELGEASKFITSLGYGTDPAKKQLKAWAEKYGKPEPKDKSDKPDKK